MKSKRPPRRQVALFILGAAWIAHGVTIMHNPGPRVVDEAIVYESWPLLVRVMIWIFTGVFTIALALAGTARAQAMAWAIVIIAPTIRLVSYSWSVLMWVIPGAPGGEPLSLAYMGWWAAVVALVWWVSRWPEPELPERRPHA